MRLTQHRNLQAQLRGRHVAEGATHPEFLVGRLQILHSPQTYRPRLNRAAALLLVLLESRRGRRKWMSCN